ncbi:MAG: hypothetical protein WBQ25_06490 [Nitrososphaeraceae archaeon]
MRKELAAFKALIAGNASIEYVNKRSMRRTPGDVTDGCGHQ